MDDYRKRSVWFAAVLILFMGGAHAESDLNKPAEQACVENTKWTLPGRQQALSTSEFLPVISGKNVILLGEFHDNVAHHHWQLHTLSALNGVRDKLAIGLEMLPPSAQAALDQWVAGALTLDAFLENSKWYDYWKFDIELYLPILEFARINKIPVYGLNVERALVKQVSQKGWDNIPLEERLGITDPAAPRPAYLEVLAASFAMHGPGAKTHGKGGVEVDLEVITEDPKFRRFVQGQQLWDRAMAQSIAAIHKASPDTLIVGIMGSGHIMNGLGVPHQLNDLNVKNVSVLLPWDGEEGCEMITEDVADAVFGVKELTEEKKNKPKLGVIIENTQTGVKVSKVMENSIAMESGIKKGDFIIRMAGVEQDNVMGVIELVQQTPPGRWLPLTVLRGEEKIEIVAKFPAEAAETD